MIIHRIIYNEVLREIYNSWSYRFQWIGELISLLFLFLFLSLISEKEMIGSNYCMWFYSVLIIGDVSNKISSEMLTGTFEQLYLSNISMYKIFFAKAVATIFKSIVLISVLMASIYIFKNENNFFLNFKFIISLIVITPGLFGISIFLGGLTLNLKNVNWILNVINNSLLFLSGIFLSIDKFPEIIKNTCFFIPTSQGNIILNNVDYLKIIFL